MSVTNANLPVLIIQLPYLARVSAVDQFHPEMQQALAEDLARQAAEKRRKTVQGTEKTQEIKQLKKEDEGKADRHSGGERQHKEPEQEEETLHTTPWAGNIINTKI